MVIMKNISRRRFLKVGSAMAAGVANWRLTIVPSSILGKGFGHVALAIN